MSNLKSLLYAKSHANEAKCEQGTGNNNDVTKDGPFAEET